MDLFDLGRRLALSAGDQMSVPRHEYRVKPLQALLARGRMLSEATLSFDEESKALFDTVAPTHPDAYFTTTLDALSRRLPGTGPLIGRYDLFRQQVEKQAARTADPSARWPIFLKLLSAPRLPSGLR